MNVTCPDCGATNRRDATFCKVCGQTLTSFSALSVGSSKQSVQSPSSLQVRGGVNISGSLSNTVAELVMPDGKTLLLQQSNIIGRDPAQSNLAFPDDSRLSRCHVRIWIENGQWNIEDMGSSNGTFINNIRISQIMQLRPGDQIGMGSVVYIFNIPGQAIIQQNSNIPVVSQPNSLQSVAGQVSLGVPSSSGWSATPVSQAPRGGWRQWNKTPIVEGYVRTVSDRYMMKKDDLMKRGIAAAALALFISPALAFLPFMHGNDIAARDVRVEDRFTGRMVDVKMLGDAMGNITIGDALAVWGQIQGGLLLMEVGFNYATETEIHLKK